MTSFPHMILAQINPVVGDIDGNLALIGRMLAELPPCDLVVFPELAVSGYPPEDLVLNSGFMDAVERSVTTFIADGPKRAFIMTTPWRRDGKIYNAAHLVVDGTVRETRFKHHLPNYGVFDEHRVFSPGPLPDPIPFMGRMLGFMICEDIWFPDVAAHLKDKGADYLIVSNASPFDVDKNDKRIKTCRARCAETGLPLAYLNCIGGQDDLVFDGGSFLMGADGTLLAQACAFAEDALDSKNIFATPYPDPVESRYRAAMLGLRDYVRKNGFSSVLLGMSGGIDSALTAAMAVDALGADHVRCIMLPSPYTSRESLDDAVACAGTLGVKLESLPIAAVMHTVENALAMTIKGALPDLTAQNLQSRVRGVLLMALSNASNALLITTGNKSEMATGYATLYGDMCGAYNPLKDIYKTDIYALSRWRNRDKMVIPDRILTKAPSAELKSDQTDQDTLPPYEVLDDILRALIDRDEPPQSITAHPAELVQSVARMVRLSEYKRRQSPPGPKTTPRAFTRERRYPITNGFKG
jgi:NAD+ synthase